MAECCGHVGAASYRVDLANTVNVRGWADAAGVSLGSIPRQSNAMRGLACVALAWPVSAITGTGRIKRGAEAMRLPLIGGPRDGDLVNCCGQPECNCQEFGHGAPDGNHIMDGFVEWLMYRRTAAGWVPDRIERQAMVVSGSCPRCQRPMPAGIKYCKNCGAEMDPLGTEWADN